ncbi:MAG: LacI family DNA-binding transcriptional regulator [Verrucomicrobia bacterium]|nr:LacI family DNA-binding transcriptional regulator [Verrucomicrobiota bacterium]MBI3867757.1 LacI family DNA-binding transcriptional regulator [Verrucomicrobiota bacterium]
MLRLKDIAERAGVSIMTVSKSLRDAPDISAGTKARICKLADELGYVPNSAAQGLRNQRTQLFGVIIPSATEPVYARITLALEDQSYHRGYDILFAHSLNQVEREERCIRRMLARRVDGLFISPVYRMSQNSPIFAELWRRQIPTVLLGHRAAFCPHFASVETEDILASYMITRHLLQLGHQRIAFFAGHPTSPSSHERLEGYRRAIREVGREVDDALIFQAGSTIEEGEKAAVQMASEKCGATALQAVNDLVAIGAATFLLSQGLRVPQDISVAGFGNILVSEHFRVPLTTIRQPKHRLGVAAMELMLRLLEGEMPPVRRLVGELVIRESTGPAPRPRQPD